MLTKEVKNNFGVTPLNRYNEKLVSTWGFLVIDASDKKKMFIRISRGALLLLDSENFRNIEFVRIGDEWFICSTQAKRGYHLSKSGKDKKLSSHLLVKTLIAYVISNEKQVKVVFKKTNLEYDSRPLFKINLGNPVPVNRSARRVRKPESPAL